MQRSWDNKAKKMQMNIKTTNILPKHALNIEIEAKKMQENACHYKKTYYYRRIFTNKTIFFENFL